jgi:polyisoprenoid-binding protein YceI
LRDVTREIRVPFEFAATAGATARLKGSTRVRRLDFGVGQGDWQGTEWIADEVRVEFDLSLRRTP